MPEIFLISNVREYGEPIGALGSERIDFHSDLSYLHKPGTLSLLYAVEVPADGGDTQWCDCRAAFDGMPPADSTALLAGLYAHMDQPRFLFTHRWRVGDLVLWDNRPTMHRRLPFPDAQRRLMKRTQIFGEEVVEA